MNLIKDTDLRKVLNIKEEEGEWLVTTFKLFFGIEKLNQLYNETSTKSGLEFIDSVINKLNLRYTISDKLEYKIPEKGPFIIIANHPLGGLDGLLLLRLICGIRPDFKLQGNYLVQRIDALKDFILPVNPFENLKSAHSSYKGLKSSYQHLKEITFRDVGVLFWRNHLNWAAHSS